MNSLTTRTAILSFDGTILVTEMINNTEVDVADVSENYNAAVKLTDGKKFLSLVIAAPHTSITKEAREEANRGNRYEKTAAQAIVVRSMANRIMGNFLIKFYKPGCPCKLFNDKITAVAWLNEEWNKKEKVKSLHSLSL